MFTNSLFGAPVRPRTLWSGFALAAFAIAALGGAACAGEPKKDDNEKSKEEQGIPVSGGTEELVAGELKIATSTGDFKFDPKAFVPEDVLKLCKEDIKKAKPPYPSIDVGKLELTSIFARNMIWAGEEGNVKKVEVGVFYITFFQKEGTGSAGGVVYVYDPRKKALTRKFWLRPHGCI